MSCREFWNIEQLYTEMLENTKIQKVKRVKNFEIGCYKIPFVDKTLASKS